MLWYSFQNKEKLILHSWGLWYKDRDCMISRCLWKRDTNISTLGCRDISRQVGELENVEAQGCRWGQWSLHLQHQQLRGKTDMGVWSWLWNPRRASWGRSSWKNRYQVKPSSDLLWQMQVIWSQLSQVLISPQIFICHQNSRFPFLTEHTCLPLRGLAT